jgi:hypothetical protein
MRIRYRLMLAAAVALTASLVGVALWPTASPPPASPEVALTGEPEARAPEPVPEQDAARAKVEPVLPRAEPRAPEATVVATGPGDSVPEPEVENAPPQQNDPIPPELPQTAKWRLEKTAHITTLLGRDVERLEREFEQAEARGDERRSQQLQRLLQRNRARLHELGQELVELEKAVKEEEESSAR